MLVKERRGVARCNENRPRMDAASQTPSSIPRGMLLKQ
jgi:hypothetical protein